MHVFSRCTIQERCASLKSNLLLGLQLFHGRLICFRKIRLRTKQSTTSAFIHFCGRSITIAYSSGGANDDSTGVAPTRRAPVTLFITIIFSPNQQETRYWSL